jgi:flagellar P-ring protein precursor FlgI
MGRTAGRWLACATLLLVQWLAPGALAERIKDLVSVQGVRPNPLIGYGLVVGLDNSGDQTTQAPFTVQSVVNMLSRLGVNVPQGAALQLRNVAAVMVTANLPPFARAGQSLDVTVSSLGNAKSLRGGTLLMTPLRGADGEIYAIAQGNVVVGGVGAQAQGGGTSVQINHLSVGRVPGGATVEREVPARLAEGGYLELELKETDFGIAQRVASAINERRGAGTAVALDGRRIRVQAPAEAPAQVALLAEIEALEVELPARPARVIVNARTGSVVMTQRVTVETCAVAHGNLSVAVSAEPVVSQPAPFSQGQTVLTERTQIEIRQDRGSLAVLQGVSLAEVVRALNAIGATPQDMIAILQAMKAAGALRAELEVI